MDVSQCNVILLKFTFKYFFYRTLQLNKNFMCTPSISVNINFYSITLPLHVLDIHYNMILKKYLAAKIIKYRLSHLFTS